MRDWAGVEEVGAAVQVGSLLFLVLISSEAGWVTPPPQRGAGYRLSAFGRSPVFRFFHVYVDRKFYVSFV